MQVPAAGVIALERGPAHEGGEISHSAADLPRRRTEQQRIIGRLQRRPRGEGALELPRSPLVLDRSQRQADLCQMIGERVISSRPIPPPRVNEAKVRALAESSVVVATLML